MKKAIFVDANVFLRFFTTDDKGQSERAARLFQSASAGRVALITGPPVLFEIAWTLRSAYNQSRERVFDVLSAILALSGLSLVDGALAEAAILRGRESGQEFADAYIAASADIHGAGEIATFNQRDFEKLRSNLHDF